MVEAASRLPVGRLSIGRLAIQAQIPRDQPLPPGIALRLEAMAREQLQPSLAAALAPLCPDSDPSVWVIRRLDLDFLVDAGWDRDRMTRRWAREFTQSLTGILHGPLDGNVLRFPDRASYLAFFLRDLAADRAWGKWYYGPFRSLQNLPRSAAIREVLAREPAIAEPALIALAAERGVDALCRALAVPDAAKVLALIRSEPAAAQATVESIEAAIEVWPEAIRRDDGTVRSKAALALQLALRVSRPRLPQAVVTAAVERVLDLAAGLGEAEEPAAWLEAALAPRPETENPAPDQPEPRQISKESRARLIELVRETQGKIVPLRPEGQRLPTAYAGLFLLWRSVVALDFEAVLAGDPTRRALLAAKLVGRAALADPAVRLLIGAETGPTAGDLGGVLRASAAEAIWSRLPSATADGACLRLEELPWPDGRRLLLLRNAAADNWLWAALASPAEAKARAAEGRAVVAALHPGLAPAAEESYLDRIRPVLLDLADLTLPPLEGETIEASDELRWSLLAHAVYRDFGRRLPGFAWSSIGHLRRNFIAGAGEIRIETQGERRLILASLPAAPLQLVLRMTGLSGSRFTLPGEPATDVMLVQPAG